ncbi:Fc.00g086520.m01.CDS01 [Cosmosporella sp. VM-42]
MDAPRELRKFPRGERCPDCGVRKWYLENGFRFCSNGHQVEGFVQFDLGAEEDSGKLGATARRDKEIKERELRHLTGQAGKNLFLECLQLILRNQLLWLITEKGHREELEIVVRDLWDLRTRGSSRLVADDSAPEGELEIFSSQPGPDLPNKAVETSRSRAQSWDPERGSDWPMPRMLDTLALCYLGCLLLRIPTRVGELCQWANSGRMPYKRAYYDLPQEMQDRLPSAYTRALKLPLRASLKGGDLHTVVLDMALSYHRNYEMLFPAIGDTPVLVQYAKQLALPVEVLAVARRMAIYLDTSFILPIQKTRVFVVDHPEILLIALIIVSAKFCFPLRGHKPLLPGHVFGQNLRFDWNMWHKIMHEIADVPEPLGTDPDFDKVTVDEVVSMTSKELDAYYAHVASLTDKRNDNSITGFFPSENAPVLEHPRPEITEEQVDNKTKRVLSRAIKIEGGGGGDDSDSEDSFPFNEMPAYEAYRLAEQLPDATRGFYTAAGNLAGISLQETIRAVYMLENRILSRQQDQRYGEEDEAENNNIGGQGSQGFPAL